MLSSRQAAILNVIVGEYVNRATPVASSSIAQRWVRVSPATVRNDMAELEEGGYILRRHVSGGGIPSTKGYRFHVEDLGPEPSLDDEEERALRARFQEAEKDLELGTKLAADLLGGVAGHVAVATFPRATHARLKRLELVALQEALVLLVLVLQEARTRQRLLHLDTSVSQGDLAALSNRLTALYAGSSQEGLTAGGVELTPVERAALDAARDILLEEDAGRLEEPYLSGLRHLLHQPEFQESLRMRALVEVLEDRAFLKEVLARLAGEGAPTGVASPTRTFRAAIGEEAETEELQECSVVVSRYGSSSAISGLVAVIGPTRMDYRRSIGAVRLISSLMGRLVGGVTPDA